MNRFLVPVLVAVLGLALVNWQRLRPPGKSGSPIDRIMGGISIGCNAGIALVSLTLPLATGFAGLPALGFAAAALLVASLFLYRVTASVAGVPLAAGAWGRGPGREPRPRSKWPFTLTSTVGYGCTLAYFATLLSIP